MNIVLSSEVQKSIQDLIAPPSRDTELEDHLVNFSTTLCRIMDSQYHAIVLFPGNLNKEAVLSSNNPPGFETLYNEELQENDFILQELIDNPHQVIQLKDLLAIKENRESYFYNKAQEVRPAGDCLYAAIHIEDQFVGFFGQVRPINSEDYTAIEKDLMKMLAPALSCHLEIFRGRNHSPDARDSGSHYDFQAIGRKFSMTKRELEILRLIFRGLTNKQIALQLNIQESTVKRHLSNIFQKTGSRNRTRLIFNTALS